MLKRRAPATMRSGNDLVAFVIYEGEKDAYAVAFVDLFVVALLNLLPHRPFGFLGVRVGAVGASLLRISTLAAAPPRGIAVPAQRVLMLGIITPQKHRT